jgi:phosphoglucosamine mutase
MIARHVFETLGADVVAVGTEPDGMNINRGVGSTHIGHLAGQVRATGADVGFAFDGDADRCIAVDGEGEVVDGDRILYILAQRLSQAGMLTSNTVVTTVMSNLGLYRALDEAGIGYTQTDVGDRFIWERMRQEGHALGGEQSGHIIVRKYATTGDGILTAILLTEAVLESGQTLHQLAAPMRSYPQLTRNLTVSDRDAVMADGAVRRRLSELRDTLADEGRILLRKSGTEPLIRIMVEAADAARCESCADDLENVIRERGY